MTAHPLVQYRDIRPRFARSVNVERDSGTTAVADYLPTARALDVVGRFARSLASGEASRALSITGPYGSGKSSLAVFIDALLRPERDGPRGSADEILRASDPDALLQLSDGRRKLGAERSGFVRAVLTAQREPVMLTVLRALERGTSQLKVPKNKAAARARVRDRLQSAIQRCEARRGSRPTAQYVRGLLEELTRLAPVILLLDEFGKNLEAYADSPAESDLYLLQQLAEWSHGQNGLPLVTITMQHLAFADYLSGAADTIRREFAKVQGRFEDIPFVDTPTQTRSLINAAWRPSTSAVFEAALDEWAARHQRASREAGLAHLFHGKSEIRGCWPLHPAAALVLPELCARYGQNERTLFSFLAGPEPTSLRSFLRETSWDEAEPLPVMMLDQVFDYFAQSGANVAAASSSASRWLEIQTLIRDSLEVSDADRSALKTIGALNLVSTGGPLRASRSVVAYALADKNRGTSGTARINRLLSKLEERGFTTHRVFADEHRLWHGSDFDLREAIETAKRRLRTASPARIVSRIKPLTHAVAGRHSQQTHTLRAFARIWADDETNELTPPSASEPVDGLAVYFVGSGSRLPRLASTDPCPKPVLLARGSDLTGLLEAAIELAALHEVWSAEERLEGDWVVRRELTERIAEADQAVDAELEAAFGPASDARWVRLGGSRKSALKERGLSQVVSLVADEAYPQAPIIRNEMLNRSELTSQGAKARRQLLEAMIQHEGEQTLGIHGYGPERAMYEAALASTGLHRQRDEEWALRGPTDGSTYKHAWTALKAQFELAKANRIGVDQILEVLLAPPIGMRAGSAPVLLTAGLLIYSDEMAIYEHGTYKPALTADLSERMVRNPAHFEVKHFATGSGVRAYAVNELAQKLHVASLRAAKPRNRSVLSILTNLVSHLVLPLPEYSRRTSHLSPEAIEVRRSLLTATEPDDLLFNRLPRALGFPPVPARAAKRDWAKHVKWIEGVPRVLDELKNAYPTLLRTVEKAVIDATGAPAETAQSILAARARSLRSEVVEPSIQALLSAFQAPLEREEWLAYVASSVMGRPPETWSDSELGGFLIRMKDLGATFRRLEAMDYEARSVGSRPADALRVTFTRADGQEDAHVVWVDEAEREVLQPVMEKWLEEAAEIAGSESRARDMFLALVAAKGESDQHQVQLPARGANTRQASRQKKRRGGQGA